jgi:hypothetical protein
VIPPNDVAGSAADDDGAWRRGPFGGEIHESFDAAPITPAAAGMRLAQGRP